eukprot:6411305-Prymnesium_polylepis.1
MRCTRVAMATGLWRHCGAVAMCGRGNVWQCVGQCLTLTLTLRRIARRVTGVETASRNVRKRGARPPAR